MSKLKILKDILSGSDGILVAFSGGVDSSLLLKTALEVLPDKVIAVTAKSEFFPRHELEEARKMASLLGARQIIIELKPLELPEISANPPERCYWCKKLLFSRLRELAAELSLTTVVDGTNADDSGDYRPGMKACRELGIRSPLLEAGLTKAEIREISAACQLPTWNMPTYACLATRIPYGTRLTAANLAMVEAGESFLKELGLKQCRLRYHGTIARVECNQSDFALIIKERNELVNYLKELGFIFVCLDLEGYQSGSMNKTILT